MKIKKGDILYQYKYSNMSDKDYCTDALFDRACVTKIDCGDPLFNPENCSNYVKCYIRPQKAVLTIVEISRKTLDWSKDTRHYNAIHLDSKNNKYGVVKEKIHTSDVDKWSKSESAALRKFNIELKDLIKNIKSDTQGYYYQSKKRNVKSFISLQKRIERKIARLKEQNA